MLFIEPHAGVAPVIHFVRDARTRLDINTYQKAPQCSACKRVAVQGGGTGHSAGNDRKRFINPTLPAVASVR